MSLMLHSPLTKGQRGLSRWREVRSELACSTPCRGQGWGRDRDMEARKIRLLCHTGHNPHRGRAANLLRKSKGEGRDVFMPPHLCPCCSSLPNVFPIYCPHLSLCCSLRHHSNVIYTMEFTLTSRMSSSLYELPGTPYLPWVILHCPHLFLCLIPTSTGSALSVQARPSLGCGSVGRKERQGVMLESPSHTHRDKSALVALEMFDLIHPSSNPPVVQIQKLRPCRQG